MECQAVRLQYDYRTVPLGFPLLMQLALSIHKGTNFLARSQCLLCHGSVARYLPLSWPSYSSTTAPQVRRAQCAAATKNTIDKATHAMLRTSPQSESEAMTIQRETDV